MLKLGPYPMYFIKSDKYALSDILQWFRESGYLIKTYPWMCKSTRFTAGCLHPVDFHMITIDDLLLLHFVLTLAETPHLRQEMST
ncbi:hypothetical protein Y032_0777g2277 [Ancylostoma ceylanicum]|uniref:Uncharacterized protein n=1 Tax=Ancylostoma ceylanicum TaxID=53326 RepID=A0A016WDA3_9BILA|nr:hypothetical protein Y032_0777g2277 [Ancylostoma ceylanicum]